MTKEQFKQIYEKNFYDLFDYKQPKIVFADLLDAEPIRCGEHLNKIEILEQQKIIKNGFFVFNQYCAIRLAGEMFTYNLDIVPIDFKMVYRTADKFSKSDAYFTFMFTCHTIDDTSMSLLKSVNNVQELEYLYNASFEFLNQYTKLPSKENFEKYWKHFKISDFSYN